MKVLHVVHNYFPSVGGSQLLIQKLSEGFANRYGDDVTVHTTNAIRSPSFLENELIAPGDEDVAGVRVRRFPFFRRHLPWFKRAMRVIRKQPRVAEYVEPLFYGPLSPPMLRATWNSDADVIGVMAFPFLQMHFPMRGRPLVIYGALHIRDDHIAAPSLHAIRNADAYVAFTEFEKRALVRRGCAADKIHVVGLGVDVDRFAQADSQLIRNRYGIGDAPIIGFVGRQARHKGCDTLVRAMERVWDRFPDAYLVIAGARTPFTPEIEALVAALPEPKRARVILANDIDEAEKPAWFSACDVFVSVSTDESFGIVYVEAWACKKPVIGGRIGAVECVIDEGRDGLLVECARPEELATAIEQLLADPDRRRELGTRGYEKIRAHQDWPAVVDKVHAIYESIV